MFKFEVGDKVRVTHTNLIGKEGVVTRLGGAATPDKGAVVTGDDFPTGNEKYGEHGYWFPDDWLELVS